MAAPWAGHSRICPGLPKVRCLCIPAPPAEGATEEALAALYGASFARRGPQYPSLTVARPLRSAPPSRRAPLPNPEG